MPHDFILVLANVNKDAKDTIINPVSDIITDAAPVSALVHNASKAGKEKLESCIDYGFE